MNKISFSLKYLGCLLTHSKKKKEHYDELIDKIKGKLQAWKGRLISYGGKEVLIKVYYRVYHYMFGLTVVPPKSVLKEMQRTFAKFFWQNKKQEVTNTRWRKTNFVSLNRKGIAV